MSRAESIPPGSIVDDVAFEVEAGKVREFVRSTGATDLAHTEKTVAQSRGLSERLATLTHSVVVGHLRDQQSFLDKLGLDIRRVVVGEVHWRYQRPLIVGDQLRATRRVISDTVKQGASGSLRLVTLETELIDQQGEPAAYVREVLVERGSAK